ncbi:hypothetical protein PMAYCL1PPCAC_20866 [Pristionchus mayeri]|uniref:Uncharacterized protein n=1 Tax=Pristionchus mayeri TaxID=1317129 RepID=A0AAN5I4Q3_9BILA|nr:hypothetical protein PMAYCL1PPCAC_20866 [Pristionchus mayeri]
MSGPIRTRIGQTRRRLLLHTEPVKTTMNTETSAKPIGERSDDELIEDSLVLLEVRSPFVRAYRALLKEHESFTILRSSSKSEQAEYEKYIKNYGDYTLEIQEASDLLAKVDSVIDQMMKDGRSRNLPMDDDIDSVSTDTGKSIEPNPLSRVPINQSKPTEESTKTTVNATLPRRMINNKPTIRTQTEDLSTPFSPAAETPVEKQSNSATSPEPQTVYVSSDSASSFVTAALVSKSLPHFSGEILNWPEFHESFLSLVKNGRITGADKLSLLKMCLSGEAQEMIAGLPQLDRNYEHAMLILQKEYDKPHLRHHSLLSRLRTLPPCDRDGKNLRSFYLKLNVIVRQLLPNGEMDSPDLLVNLITSKLPISMQTRIIKESSRKPDFGVYSVLSILADAVEDEKIERDIMANNRYERRMETTNPSIESIPDLAKLEEMMRNFYSVEMIGVSDSPELTDDDNKAYDHFLKFIQLKENENDTTSPCPSVKRIPNYQPTSASHSAAW